MVSQPARATKPRWAVAVLLALGCLLPPTIIGVRAAIRSNVNDVRDWLPGHFQETKQFRWFQDRFGNDEFVVVSWPGCTLSDERLEVLATRLAERSKQSESLGNSPLFVRVTSGKQMVEDMETPRYGLKRQQAIARLQGTLIGPENEPDPDKKFDSDKMQTCAIVTLSEPARRKLRSALEEIRAAAVDAGVPATDVHLGGPAVVNDAIDQSSTQSLVRLAALAGLVGVVVAWLCFRDLRLTLIVFVIAGYSAAMSLAAVPLCGVSLNAILVTMVPLVYVAAMSGAIHLSNYYRESVRRVGAQAAIGDAIRHAALPLGLATTTTAVGLVSLWYSDLFPIRLFGVFSAVGVMIGLAMQLIALPALLQIFPPAATKSPAGESSNTHDDHDLEPLTPGWQRFCDLVTRRHVFFSLMYFVCLLAAGAGLSRTETSIQIMRLFAPDTPIIHSYDWLEKHLGAMVPMEVAIRFDADNKQDRLQRLELVRELHDGINELDGVSGALSAATFTPKMNSPLGSRQHAADNFRWKRTQPHLTKAGYLYASDQEEVWRISVRVTAGEDLDYGEFQQQLRAKVEPILARNDGADKHGTTAIYTGAVPIVYKARRSLLNGLIWGFGTDVLLVVVSVILLMRNAASGLLMFLTSIFPITAVFGLMGWAGWVVDIGSVMAPCVALGVTIDDAIHFLLWYRRGMDKGLKQPEAVALAFAGCGQAMVQSWGVIGLGLSVFALSQFIPTFRFGFLAIALLTISLVCNLIFLPALLSGPLGRLLAGGKTIQKT